MNTRSKAMRNTLFSFVTIYVEYILGMLTSILIARELEPSHFGSYSLIIWMAGLGVAITNAGTATAAIKFVAELRGAGHESMVPTMLAFLRRAQHVFLVAVIAVGALVLWFAGDELLPGYDHRWVFAALAVAVTLRAPYMFNVGVAKGFENFRATAIIAGITTPINLLLVGVAWLTHVSVMGFLLVYVATSLIFYLASRQQVTQMLAPLGTGIALPAELRKRVLRHMRIVAITVAVSFVSVREVEVLFLNVYTSAAAAGQFKVAYQLASGAALLVPGVFSALLLPMMAHAVTQGSRIAGQKFVASTSYLTVLAVPLVAFGVIFSAPIINVLYGANYAAAAPVFAVLLCAGAMITLGAGASSLLISADQQQHILMLSIASSVLKVGLDWWWVKFFGLPGAVAANVTVAVLGTIAVVALALVTTGARLAWGRLGRILLAGGIAALVAWPLHHMLAPIARLLAGFVLVSLVYALATVLFGCWSRGDIAYMQLMLQRWTGGRPRVVASLLEWASLRAGEEG